MVGNPEHDGLLSPAEAAVELHLSVTTVYNHLAAGRLPAVRIGRFWRIRREDLDEVRAHGLPLERKDQTHGDDDGTHPAPA